MESGERPGCVCSVPTLPTGTWGTGSHYPTWSGFRFSSPSPKVHRLFWFGEGGREVRQEKGPCLEDICIFLTMGVWSPAVCSAPPFPTCLPFVPLGLIYLFLGLVSGASSLSNNQPCEVRWVFPEITSQKIMQLKCKGKKKHSCCLILCFN